MIPPQAVLLTSTLPLSYTLTLTPSARPPLKNTPSAVLKLTPPLSRPSHGLRPCIHCHPVLATPTAPPPRRWLRPCLLLLCIHPASAGPPSPWPRLCSVVVLRTVLVLPRTPPRPCPRLFNPQPCPHLLRAGPRPRWPCPEFSPSVLGRLLASFASSSFLRLCPQACLGLGDLFCPEALRHRPLACLALPLRSGAPSPWVKLCCPLKLCPSGSQQRGPDARGLDTEFVLDLELTEALSTVQEETSV